MEEIESGNVMEGFLCPICVIDFKSPVKLSSHFEDAHADDKVVQQFKSVMDKAKRKLRKDDISSAPARVADQEGSNSTASSAQVLLANRHPGTGGIDTALWEKQSVGVCTSLTGEFSMKRKVAIEGMVVETNKLIIRLEKLIKSGIYAAAPSPAVGLLSRKAKEKSVIPWDSDSNAKNCVSCSKKFSLTNRRHHCRLCGKVVCGECLDKLDMSVASGILKLDASKASLYIRTDDNDNETGLQVCDPCSGLLDRQHKLIQDQQANNDMLLLYDKMKLTMKDADTLQPKYLKMAESVNLGETEFHLETATETRVRLLKLYESIDAVSKRIQHLGMDEETGTSPQLLKLHKMVRMYASNYLTENMFILPTLPTLEKYTEMLSQKKVNPLASSSAAGQHSRSSSPKPTGRQDTLESSEKTHEKDNPSGYKSNEILKGKATDISSTTSLNGISNAGNQNAALRASKHKVAGKETRPIQAVSISKTQGSSWGPVQPQVRDSSSSVISQQIQIVRGYLSQARQAGKQDEVMLFEENLRELMAMEKQQRGDP